jgi:antitoxin CcdA
MRMAIRAKKTPTNLSVREDLVARAKALHLNLSELLEAAMEKAIVEAQREEWLARNQDSIRAYNARVARRGVFSDGRRRF